MFSTILIQIVFNGGIAAVVAVAAVAVVAIVVVAAAACAADASKLTWFGVSKQ